MKHAAAVLWLTTTVLGCSRVTESVGRVREPDAAIVPAIDAREPSPDILFATGGTGGSTCVPDQGLATLPAPVWNCGERCYRDFAVPVEAPTRFAAAATTTGAPVVRYPLAGSVHPVNLPTLTFHWTRDKATDQLFRIRLSRGTRAYELYVPCIAPPLLFSPADPLACTYPVAQNIWLRIAGENRNETLDLEVAGAASPGGAVPTSTSTSFRFSPGVVDGAFYFWSTTDSSTNETTKEYGRIWRAVFGASKASEFVRPGTSANRFTCAGCHAVSRDGRKLAFSAEQPDGYLTVLSTDRPESPIVAPPQPPVPDANMMSFSPDGSRLVISYGRGNGDNGHVVIRNTTTGAVEATLDPSTLGIGVRKIFMPEWSPLGREIVAVAALNDERPWSVNDGSIVVFRYENGQFSNGEILVPATSALSHFYPTWSPDGRYIAFASAPGGSRSSYNHPQARLRILDRTNPTRIVDLMAATRAVGLTSTWPKFAPFMQSCGNLMFLTFNSKMDYGVVIQNTRWWPTEAQHDDRIPQLWMTAIDISKIATNEDPSSAPIWLPFQLPERRQRTHLGFWTTQIVCTNDAQGRPVGCDEGLLCENGRCVVPPYD